MAERVKKQPAFEQQLGRLEALAQQMETGGMELEAMLKTYEEGMALADSLLKRLNEAKGQLLELKAGKESKEKPGQATLLDGLEEQG